MQIKKEGEMKRMVFVVSVAVLVFSVAVTAQTSVPQPGPEYKILDAWAGEWTIQVEVKDSPSGPAYKVDWTLKGQRILGGFCLQVHHTWRAKGAVQNGLEVTGWDQQSSGISLRIRRSMDLIREMSLRS